MNKRHNQDYSVSEKNGSLLCITDFEAGMQRIRAYAKNVISVGLWLYVFIF